MTRIPGGIVTLGGDDAERRGACPAAGSPMASGDGLLIRVRLPGGRLEVTALRRLAAWAETAGAGVLEVTGRGNLQIRGLNPDRERRLTADLVALGLAVDPPAAERVRNLLCSAAADLDPRAVDDPYLLAQRLEQRLVHTPELWGLPPKFRVVLNGGGVTHLADTDADIRADAVRTRAGIRYRLALAGTAGGARVMGICEPDRLPDCAVTLMETFIVLNRQLPAPARRLSTLLAAFGDAPFRRALPAVTAGDPALPHYPRKMAPGPAPHWFAAGVPMGELSASGARQLADVAEARGLETIRVTPDRCVLLPGAGEAAAGPLAAQGLIVDDGDPRLPVAACPGSPACGSGYRPARQDALAWITAAPDGFGDGVPVHVAGCGKGCAHPGPGALTLVAGPVGYDLVVGDRARPRDPEAIVLRALAPEGVPEVLRYLACRLRERGRPAEAPAETLARLGIGVVRDWLQAFRNSRRWPAS